MNADLIPLIDRVDAYYSGAFSQLMTITLAVLGFVGVIIPLLVQYYQGRILKRDSKQFEEFARLLIKDEIGKMKLELTDAVAQEAGKMDTKLTQKEKELSAQISRATARIEARYWHTSALSCEKDKSYGIAAIFYIRSAVHYMSSKDEGNLVTTINNMKDILNECTESDFSDPEQILSEYKDFIEKLKEFDRSGRYLPEIDSLEVKMKAAKKRKPKTT